MNFFSLSLAEGDVVKLFCIAHCCRRQEEPAILMSRLLLRTLCMYVASLGLPLRMNRVHITQFDHAHLDLLSLVIGSRIF